MEQFFSDTTNAEGGYEIIVEDVVLCYRSFPAQIFGEKVCEVFDRLRCFERWNQ